MFSSFVNVAVVTDSTCLSAEIVYVFLPVSGSTVGFPTVTRAPAVISVPKPVITFLPASVILDKSVLANPVAPMVTLPLASFEMLILSPFFRFTLLFLGVTSSPLTDKFQRSDFFATPVMVSLSPVSTPFPLTYGISITSLVASVVPNVYVPGFTCFSLVLRSFTVSFKSYTLTAPVAEVVTAVANFSVYVALAPEGAATLLMLEPTLDKVGALAVAVFVLPVESTNRVLTSVTAVSRPGTGFSVV